MIRHSAVNRTGKRRHLTGLPLCALCVVGLPALAQAPNQTLSPESASDSRFCAPVRASTSGALEPVFASNLISPPLADLLRRGYRPQYGLRQIEGSSTLLETARKEAIAEHSACGEALAVFRLASNAENGRFDNAADLYRLSITLFHSLGSPLGEARAHFGLGATYAYKTDKNAAAAEFALAADAFKTAGNREDELYTRLTSADLAGKADYPAFIAEARSAHYPCVEARAHSLLSASLRNANRLDESMREAETTDALLSQCPGRLTERAAVQTAMGRLERQQGRPNVALEHYRLALKLQLRSGDLSLVPQTYNAMAVAYDSVLDFKHSIPLYKKGLAFAKQIHSQPFIDFLQANLASTYSRSGHANLAVPLLERLTQNLPSDTLRCTRFWQLGRAYLGIHRPEAALLALNVALPACRSEKDKSRIVNTLEVISRAEIALHHYDEALRDSHESLALVEEQRAHLIPEDAYKQGYIDQEKSIFDDTVQALTAEHKAGEALEVAEQARARAFLDLLASRKLAPAVSAPNGTPAEATAGQDVHKDPIASPGHVPALTAPQMLEATARLHSTLISYWVTDDELYIWIARPDQPLFEATRPISAEQLQQLVDRTRQPSKFGSAPNPAWTTLYRLLLGPIEQQLPPGQNELLTIVPAGPLFALSFSALRAPSTTRTPHSGSYLLERFRIHTVPTVGVLPYTRRNAENASAKPEHLLFVANPAHPPLAADGHPLPELQGAEIELNAIARVFPPGEVVRLEGRDATRPQVVAALPDATIVHFATHAVLSEKEPYDSFLALENDRHDGKLSVADVYRLHLTARLVVLSACRTGLGTISGDGVAGMSRAFFYAGSASVLTTLWDVADQPTARMMPRFYQALQQGSSPSEALRSAQLATLADLRAGRISAETFSGFRKLPPDPIFWAGFSLSGEP